MAGHHKSNKIGYCNSFKCFRRPVVPFLVSKTQNINIPIRFNHDILNDILINAQKQCYAFSSKSEAFKNVGTQTDYRDSEAQTIPWEPSYRIKLGHNPEVLSIVHLTWNHGLQIGNHELEIINRIRKKRAWEAILPPMDTQANIKKRTAIINALEVDEWAFRESEIQAIMDYRLELMNEISKSYEYEKQKKIQDRLDRLTNLLSLRRDKEVNSIKHKLRRELRKLYKRHQEKSQPFKRDIIKEHANPSSELYAPQMRYGEHPQRRHEIIEKELLGESFIENVTEINTLPKWLPTYEQLSVVEPKPKSDDLCIRATRWTKEKLIQLHSDLKAIRLSTIYVTIDAPVLLKRKYKMPSLPPTPYKTTIEDIANIRLHQLSTLIQKIVRGRAIQCMMFEGRNRCRELIEELQSSYGLEEYSKKQNQKEKQHTLELQELQNEKSLQDDRLCEILNSLEGMTLSGMLDFLTKELIRLEDERQIHAFALLAERKRALREAAEAGKRQLEYNRRREFDEIFKQIIKINQDSVETYLEDIIKEGIEWVSDEATKAYISELCDTIDNVSKVARDNETKLAEEEMIANMIYNFVLPEIEKTTLRKNIREKQQVYLQNAHAVIYNKILNLSSVEDKN
ncbi:cilia- and flagella-associated protein 91-like isoform X2 [Apis dorsata]|nr:cilia- and flagella-associated protein 91-like isoform X2 [Apis dorsata]XP_006623173.1 cilia- and flagella-associated protein 91-like isoform X2 [Apis dorsata]XP_006623174.1 cilia- and flagella-associated protein 91-like isoform X2 [Apis dorsata]